jgi:hypothetical protein
MTQIGKSLCTYDLELVGSDVAITIYVKLGKCGSRSVLPFVRVGLFELVDMESCCNELVKIHHSIRIGIHLWIQGANQYEKDWSSDWVLKIGCCILQTKGVQYKWLHKVLPLEESLALETPSPPRAYPFEEPARNAKN